MTLFVVYQQFTVNFRWYDLLFDCEIFGKAKTNTFLLVNIVIHLYLTGWLHFLEKSNQYSMDTLDTDLGPEFLSDNWYWSSSMDVDE